MKKTLLVYYLLILTAVAAGTDHFHTKLVNAIKKRQKIFEHNNVIYKIVIRENQWATIKIGHKEAPNPSSGGVLKVSELSTTRSVTTMKGLLITAALSIAAADAGFFDWNSPQEKFNAGSKLTGKLCQNHNSPECTELRDRYWVPDLVAQANTTPAAIQISPDPCVSKQCYSWGKFRKQVISPLLKQLGKHALDKFTDDAEGDSLFSSGSLGAWKQVMELPPANQALSGESASALSLKLMAAALSQIRLTRVEQLEYSGVGWKTWLSVPGCALLAIYFVLSLQQIKSYWRRRNVRNENLKSARLMEQLIQHHRSATQGSGERATDTVAIDMGSSFLNPTRH